MVALAGAAIAPVLAVTLPAPTANAHGWITSPSSRQDQCANRTVSCGQIQYEPQSVEGPKGLRSCSGGNSRFAELDDDGKGWRVHSVGSSTTFSWRLTAQHATSTWQYYVGGQKVAEFNDGGQRPPANVSHNVNFGGISGRQKVLAVWNIADTGNAFYACVDVNINGPGDPSNPDPTNPDPTNPDPTDPDPTNPDPTDPGGSWAPGVSYAVGATVTYGGATYRCLQAHTSQAGWTPTAVPALWQRI
jgi:chitin-binding protein